MDQQTDFRCNICFAQFTRRTNLNIHISHIHNSDTARLYKCDLCTNSYTVKHQLKIHKVVVHEGKRPYCCRTCNATFTCMSNMKRHEKSVHRSQERKFKCGQCSRAYLNEANLKRHFRTHTGQKDFVCMVCNAAFNTKSELKLHSLKHSGIKRHKCHICNASYKVSHGLKHHLANKHGLDKIIYTCDTCSKSFISKTGLNRHKLTHDIANKKHKCTLCEHTTFTKSELRGHILAKHRDGAHWCRRCTQSFKSSAQLEEHDNMFKGSMCVCQRCDRMFCTQERLDRHKKSVHLTKSKTCAECQRAFHSTHGLDIHIKVVHLGASDKSGNAKDESNKVQLKDKTNMKQTVLKRIKCGSCEAEFYRIGGLTRHLKSHPKPHLFQCVWCRKKYTNKVAFKKHLNKVCKKETPTQKSENNKNADGKKERKTTKEKKINICLQCQRIFKSKYQLDRHLPKHDTRTYPCSICDKILSSKPTLRRHILEHNRTRLFTCITCRKSFKQRSHLKAHFLTHLGIKRFACSVCHIRLV